MGRWYAFGNASFNIPESFSMYEQLNFSLDVCCPLGPFTLNLALIEDLLESAV
jgi:hypothetical protein